MSKKLKAQVIFDSNPTFTRSQMIAAFIEQLNMTQACASTYYSNCKKPSQNVDHKFQASTTKSLQPSSNKVVEGWMQRAIAKHNDVCRLAEQLFNVDLSSVDVLFDLKSKCAGMACRRGTRYFIRYNPQAMQDQNSDHGLNATIPHEIAHIVCMINPKLGYKHDLGWKMVCVKLGGSGARCHNLTLTNGKKTTKYFYNVDGVDVEIGPKYHEKIQMGSTSITLRSNKSTIFAHHFVSKVEK
jgi:predicted SprT family Zn-dependent metalloprotease